MTDYTDADYLPFSIHITAAGKRALEGVAAAQWLDCLVHRLRDVVPFGALSHALRLRYRNILRAGETSGMRLIKCKACAADISSKAYSCPQCGHPDEKIAGRKTGAGVCRCGDAAVGLVILLALAGIAFH